MRVLQLVTRNELRGAEVFAGQLSEGLTRRGHHVCLAALYARPEEALPLDLSPAVEVQELRGKVKGRLELRVWSRFLRLLRGWQPDVLQANAFHALKYAALAKRLCGFRWPIVYRNISLASDWVPNPWKRHWGRWLFQTVGKVVSVSDRTAEDLSKTYGVPARQVATIRRGVEVPQVTNREQARHAVESLTGIPPGDPLLFHIGGMSAEKNHSGLLQAFAAIYQRVPSCQLVLCGDGPLRSELEKQAFSAEVARRVHFLGTRSDARELLAAADLLLLPSHIEGIPGVVLEAAARGVPAICTDVGGVCEAVAHAETGILVGKDDVTALADETCRLLGHDELRRRMGEKARQRVLQSYSLDAAVTSFEAVYEELASEGDGDFAGKQHQRAGHKRPSSPVLVCKKGDP